MPNIFIGFGDDGFPCVKSDEGKRFLPVTLTNDESEAVNIISASLSDVLSEAIHLERRTDAYLTLVVCEYCDFCRLKISQRSKWFSVATWPKNPSELIESGWPEPVNDKKQCHWKYKLVSVDDLKNYSDLILQSYKNAVYSGE